MNRAKDHTVSQANWGDDLWHNLGAGVYLLLSVIFVYCGGCSQYIDPNVPERILPILEPQFDQEYLLYRPSSYDRSRAWPLIVLCHASWPDSSNAQIRDWDQLAESKGFLILAPKLDAIGKRFGRSPEEQRALQEADEERILAAIRHARGAHNISDDRVFIHGWSSGACAALHTGLKHPGTFRALSLAEPKFDATLLADVQGQVDPHQPVFISYSISDHVTGKHARRCIDWLGVQGISVREDPSGHGRRGIAQRGVAFFEGVIRNLPWIQIHAVPQGADDPLAFRFRIRSSPTLARLSWQFGDGVTSHLPKPRYTYESSGTYKVVATATLNDGSRHRRSIWLSVPEGRAHAGTSP